MKAAAYAAERREQAARTGQVVPRMSETLPSLHVREKLFVWVDKGRVRTSDGPMRGHEIASVLLNTDNDTDSRREIVLPTIRVLRLPVRSDEHTSELQSRGHIVCRLLREKKKETTMYCQLQTTITF